MRPKNSLPAAARAVGLSVALAVGLVGTAAAETWAKKLGYGGGAPDTKVLIRHADDAGMFMTANAAIQAGMTAWPRQIDSTSAMPPLPFFDAMVDWYRNNPNQDVGLHLTHTSEWTNYRWGPAAEPPKAVKRILTRHMVFRKDSLRVFFLRAPNTVGKEIQAQINRALVAMNPPLSEATNPCIHPNSRRPNYGPPPPGWKLPAKCQAPTHLDSHMGSLYTRRSYFKKFLGRVLKNDLLPISFVQFDDTFECIQNSGGLDFDKKLFKWHIRRLEKAQEFYDTSPSWQYRRPKPKVDYYCSFEYGDSFDETRNKLKTFLQNLKPGITMLLFHPSYDGWLLRISSGHWQRRVWDSKLYADPQIRATLANQHILTTTWREMTQRCQAQGIC